LPELARLVEAGSMALPSFSPDDMLFPGRAGRGRLVGPPPDSPAARRALATLYAALLTDACIETLGVHGTVVLDGPFIKVPLDPALVAALRPGERVMVSRDAYGTASGTALLASHETRTQPALLAIEAAEPATLPGLPAYRSRWRNLVRAEPADTEVER
jgi:hypothetical protein